MTTALADRRRDPVAFGYQPALDGLRGVAVATVLLYHAGVPWMVGGYLGVSTFFTLSGFLITSLLLAEHERTGRIRLTAFWERRLRRIMPAALAGLCLVLAFGALAADAYQREHLRGDVLATLAYVVNWWFIATRRDYVGILGSPSPVQHYWSLAIEEQFYLAFPLLTALVLRIGSRRALAAILALLSALSVSLVVLAPAGVPEARLYYGTDTRIAELLAGALLAVALHRRGRAPTAGPLVPVLGMLGLAVSTFFWTSVPVEDARLYRGGLALYALASVMVVAAAVAPGGPVRRGLAVAPLRWLGRVSYGLYLYHFPVYLWLSPERTGLGDWQLLALRVPIALALAIASYRWLEWPIRTGARVLAWRRWVMPPLAMGSVAAACLLVTAGPPRTDAVTAAVQRRHAARPAAAGEPVTILVVGDSHAAGSGVARDETLAAHLERLLAARRAGRAVRVVNLGRPGMNSTHVAGGLDEHIATYDPRLVIVWAGVRDMFDAADAGPARGGWVVPLRRLAGLVLGAPRAGRHPQAGEVARVLARDLDRIAATARASGTGLVFVNYPVPYGDLNHVIHTAGERLGVPVVESANDYWRAAADGHTRDELLFDFAGPHPTGLFYRYIAESTVGPVEAVLDGRGAAESG